MNKLISVVIPAYNVQDWVKECIQYCLNQTYKNIEILIYNDGSTDNTLQVLKQFSKNKKVKIFTCKSNKGVSCARNYLLDKAQGDYIMLQDADDKSLKSRADECFRFLENNDYIFTSCNIQTSMGNIFSSSIKDEYMVVLQQFEYRKPLGGASSFFDRCVIDQRIRYDENLLAGEDLFFDVEVQGKFPLKMIGLPNKTPYYWYRKREDSLTALRREKDLTPEKVMKERNIKIEKIMVEVMLNNKERILEYLKKETSLYSDRIRKLYETNVK